MGFHCIIEGLHAIETAQGGESFQHVNLHHFVMMAISMFNYCDSVIIICVSKRETSN